MQGSQTPRIHVMPDSVASYGQPAFEFLADHDMLMDEWQRLVVSDWLAVGEDGKWAAPTCGLSVPRQNGKTFALKGRCYEGICSLGETILYTAHEVKTSRKTFEEMAADFDAANGYQDLSSQVDYIRRANGQEEIKIRDWQDDEGEWHTGGRIIFSARSRGAARGFTADVFIADEAQELTGEQMAALMPTISAGRLQNPQTIMIGTPPAPGDIGDIFENTRKSALKGSDGVCWHEWSVDEVGDVFDMKRVAETNPAFGKRLMESAVKAEMSTMPPDYFARERLGWWSKNHHNAVINASSWESCKTATPPMEGVTCFAVKFAPDGMSYCISAAIRTEDGAYVEAVHHRPITDGLTFAADFMEKQYDRAAQVVVDGKSHSGAFVDMLKARGFGSIVLVVPSSGDVATACATFTDAVVDGRVSHMGQKELTESATRSVKRRIGSGGGWGFDGDANPILVESCALAYWQAVTTRRDPNRKVRIA